MYRIVIIELDHHFEVLLNTCRIFNELNYNVTVVTKEKFKIELQKVEKFENIKWITQKESNLYRFMQSITDELNRNDLILFNTFSKFFKEIVDCKLTPLKVLRVHNANAYFLPSKSISLSNNPYYFLKGIKYLIEKVLIRHEHKYRRIFLESINYFTFPTKTISDYVTSQNFVDKTKIIDPIPWLITSPDDIVNSSKDKIYITLPGQIDIRKRNYKQLFEALNNIKDKIESNVVLTFLGKPKNNYELRTIKKFYKLENDRVSFKAFEDWVPQVEFESLMHKTDFLVIPLKKYIRFTIYGEISGHTKISGNVNDILLYSRPALISSFYPLDANLNKVTETFSNTEELSRLLLEWINKKTYVKLNQHFSAVSEEYNLKSAVQKTEKIISSILN